MNSFPEGCVVIGDANCGTAETSVSISADGRTLAFTLPKVYVYRFIGGEWVEFTPEENEKVIGTGVILSHNGNRVAIGMFCDIYFLLLYLFHRSNAFFL